MSTLDPEGFGTDIEGGLDPAYAQLVYRNPPLFEVPLFFGPPKDAFGHGGAGGSCHGARPQHRVRFSYCMNHLRKEESDYRARRLLAALAQAIGA